MQYEPIKESVNRFFSRSAAMRKVLYFLLDILLLRAWHVKRVLKKVAGQFPGEASVLDAGSGLGQYTWTLSRLNSSWTIKAVDINAGQVRDLSNFAEKTGLSSRVITEVCDLTVLGERERYDIVLCVDVMEHIEEDVLVFSNFFRAMKSGGILVISTPSDKGGSDAHDETDRSFIDEHVRNGYNVSEIRQKLSSVGFTKTETRYTYGTPGSLSWKLSMKYPVKMLNLSYLFFLVLPFYYIIVFPVSLILNFLDVNMKHESGTGLVVIAGK